MKLTQQEKHDKLVRKGVIAGRKFPLMGVKECRVFYKECDPIEHETHVRLSGCCNAPVVLHISNGEIIVLCFDCVKPQYRFQLGFALIKE